MNKQEDYHKIMFLAEGYLEVSLLSFFKIPFNEIENTQTISKIQNTMKAKQAKDFEMVLVALIDGDKDLLKFQYFNEFLEEEILEENNFIENIIFKKHPDFPHYLVIVSSVMERFLINLAKKYNIMLSTYQLPEELSELTKVTKKESIIKNENWKMFLENLLENSSEFQQLKMLLRNKRKK